jgi:acyl dehydratase
MFFEDVVVGAHRELGAHTFRQEEIIAFARRYDPLPIHLDPEAAKASPYGGLVASGWLVTAIWMGLMVEDRLRSPSEGPAVSPGFQDLRWLKPVRPGTRLWFSTEVTGKTDWKTRPELGLVLSNNQARDDGGEIFLRFTGKVLLARREVP